jgi:hypothetical protein
MQMGVNPHARLVHLENHWKYQAVLDSNDSLRITSPGFIVQYLYHFQSTGQHSFKGRVTTMKHDLMVIVG